MHFLIDSNNADKNYSFNTELWSMKIPESPNSSLELIADPGAFESIYGYKNDSIHLIFRQKKRSSYGDIYLNVKCENCNSFIIQLIKQDNIIQSFICNDHTFNYFRLNNFDLIFLFFFNLIDLKKSIEQFIIS